MIYLRQVAPAGVSAVPRDTPFSVHCSPLVSPFFSHFPCMLISHIQRGRSNKDQAWFAASRHDECVRAAVSHFAPTCLLSSWFTLRSHAPSRSGRCELLWLGVLLIEMESMRMYSGASFGQMIRWAASKCGEMDQEGKHSELGMFIFLVTDVSSGAKKAACPATGYAECTQLLTGSNWRYHLA